MLPTIGRTAHLDGADGYETTFLTIGQVPIELGYFLLTHESVSCTGFLICHAEISVKLGAKLNVTFQSEGFLVPENAPPLMLFNVLESCIYVGLKPPSRILCTIFSS